MVTDADIKRLMDKLTPEQRGVAQTLAQFKVENTMLKAQAKALQESHDVFFRALVTLLKIYRDSYGREYVLLPKKDYDSELINEYRVDSCTATDTKTGEEYYRFELKHIRDPLSKTEVNIDGTIVGN